MQINIIIKQ